METFKYICIGGVDKGSTELIRTNSTLCLDMKSYLKDNGYYKINPFKKDIFKKGDSIFVKGFKQYVYSIYGFKSRLIKDIAGNDSTLTLSDTEYNNLY